MRRTVVRLLWCGSETRLIWWSTDVAAEAHLDLYLSNHVDEKVNKSCRQHLCVQVLVPCSVGCSSRLTILYSRLWLSKALTTSLQKCELRHLAMTLHDATSCSITFQNATGLGKYLHPVTRRYFSVRNGRSGRLELDRFLLVDIGQLIAIRQWSRAAWWIVLPKIAQKFCSIICGRLWITDILRLS